jgi:hypothetical protein
MQVNRWWVGATLALGLVACGGGGGGDGGSAGVEVPQGVRSGSASTGSDVTAVNATSFAGPLARTVMSAADGSAGGVASGREAPQARSAATTTAGRWSGFVFDAAARSLSSAAGREQALAVATETVSCSMSGTVTLTVNDADNNQKLSAGDTATFQFNACVEVAGMPAASGTLSFTVNAIELNAQNEPTALDASFTLTGFVEAGFGTTNGSFRTWFKDESSSSTRQRISFLGASVVEAGQTRTYDFDVYGVVSTAGGNFDLNGAIGIGGQTYAMSSTVFSHNSGAMPSVGALTLRDGAGDAVILRARSATTFDLEFQAAGSATPTVIAAGQLWNDYRLP